MQVWLTPTLRLEADGNILPPSESFPKAKAAAMKALELDDTLAEAHAAASICRISLDWDWPSAEREFKRAIELNPNSALSHRRYAEFLQTRARFSESIGGGPAGTRA